MDSTTACPSLGTLRAHLDHEAPDVAAHLDDCGDCRDTIVTLADRAGGARRLLAILEEPAPGPGPAANAGAACTGPARRRDRARPEPTRRRGRLRERAVLVAGAAGLVVLGATVGQPVVAQVLDSFRSQQVQPVVIEPRAVISQLRALEDIAEVRDIVGETFTGDLDDVAAAAELAQVPAPDLAEVADAVAPRVEATSAVGARIAFRSTPDVPASLHGVVVEVVAPGVMIVGDDDAGELVVAVARAIEVSATGASLDDVRTTLLNEVDLPADLRDQLVAMDDWRTALPVPVPADPSLWDEVVVGGAPGLAIGHGHAFGAVVWQEGNVVRAVGGQRGVDELVGLAGRL